jgi:DNA ligase-1
MTETPFARLAELGQRLEQTSKRLELAALLANFLQGLEAEEIPPAIRMTIGQVFPEWDGRALNVSWRTVETVLAELVEAAPAVRDEITRQAVDGGEAVRMLLEQARRQPPQPPPLTILEVFHAFEAIAETAGKGSQARKEALVRDLLVRATPVEAKYLVKIIYQEMRHGVNEGLMLEAMAKAAGLKLKEVQRANQLWGDLGEVGRVALTAGGAGLKQVSVRMFHPLKPMLAQTAEEVGEAFAHFGGRLRCGFSLPDDGGGANGRGTAGLCRQTEVGPGSFRRNPARSLPAAPRPPGLSKVAGLERVNRHSGPLGRFWLRA